MTDNVKRPNLVHGGEAAVKAIQKGDELTGLARNAELAVYAELEASGRYVIVVRNAARLQAAADLYWNAVAKAAQDGNLEALDKYIKRYGWLASSSLRAWAQVKDESGDGQSGDLIIDAVTAAREVGDEHNDAG